MTASEFAFLALGLVLGVASGAALSIVIRARPPAPREVRVTMAADAIPRRLAATLSGIIPGDESPSPAWRPAAQTADITSRDSIQASLAPRTSAPLTASVQAPEQIRTPVRSSARARPLVGIPIQPSADGPFAMLAVAAISPARAVTTERGQAAGGHSSLAGVVAAGTAAVAAAPGTESPSPVVTAATFAATADADPAGADPDATRPSDHAEGLAEQAPCTEQRRRAEERCGLASRLREEASAARARIHEAQRAYDDHLMRVERGLAAADPRSLRLAKEGAWDAFRQANAGGRNPATVEAAARTWLTEIDRINRSGSAAAADAVREQTAARALVTTLERLSLDADVARINVESAAEACQASLEALAACEESAVDASAGRQPVTPLEAWDNTARARLLSGPQLEATPFEPWDSAAPHPFGDRQPVILKLLHGDRDALRQAVIALAGENPAEQARWRHGLSELVEAIVARAIEATALEFPADHPFWGPFSQMQCRDIATALSSLGYRYDGLGGFADGRLPSQRDLSLAIGYAGLDPMRVRRWPTEATMTELYRQVAVAADEFLSATAPDLTLGELLSLLGERAEELTDLWNAWGRVRPVLLRP